MPPTILRPATPQDHPFLWRLHIDTMKQYVHQTWGWEEAFQQERFNNHYLDDAPQIIQSQNKTVGLITTTSLGAFTFLKQIAITPTHQNQGLGTQLINQTTNQAHQLGAPVILQVLTVNPAQKLYQSLNFKICGQTKTHTLMINKP